jgi:hypothetical protein
MWKRIQDPNFEYRTALPLAAKWLILELSSRKFPFKVVELGAGVKLITRKTDICPKCNGTGRI